MLLVIDLALSRYSTFEGSVYQVYALLTPPLAIVPVAPLGALRVFVATHAVEVNGPTYRISFSASNSSTVAIPPPLEVTTSPTINAVPF